MVSTVCELVSNFLSPCRTSSVITQTAFQRLFIENPHSSVYLRILIVFTVILHATKRLYILKSAVHTRFFLTLYLKVLTNLSSQHFADTHQYVLDKEYCARKAYSTRKCCTA